MINESWACALDVAAELDACKHDAALAAQMDWCDRERQRRADLDPYVYAAGVTKNGTRLRKKLRTLPIISHHTNQPDHLPPHPLAHSRVLQLSAESGPPPAVAADPYALLRYWRKGLTRSKRPLGAQGSKTSGSKTSGSDAPGSSDAPARGSQAQGSNDAPGSDVPAARRRKLSRRR